jgi:putative transcriptional regulator
MVSPASGILLISDPFLKDPNFMRTVVLLCEHKEEGSFGFVLNKKYENTLDELVDELPDSKMPVYYGGPVETNTLHFLHQYPDEIPGSVEILKGIYWGGDFEMLIDKIKRREVDENKIRFFIGYSGWGQGQLADELKEKSWLTAEATKKLVFHKNYNEVWKDSLKHLGGDYEIMVNFPIDPQLN